VADISLHYVFGIWKHREIRDKNQEWRGEGYTRTPIGQTSRSGRSINRLSIDQFLHGLEDGHVRGDAGVVVLRGIGIVMPHETGDALDIHTMVFQVLTV